MPETVESIATDIVSQPFPMAGPFGPKYKADAVDDFLDSIVVGLRVGTTPADLIELIHSTKIPAAKSPFTSGYQVDAVDDFLASLARRLHAL